MTTKDPTTIEEFRAFIIREVKKHRPEWAAKADELADNAVGVANTDEKIAIYMRAYRREPGHRRCK